MKLFLRNIYLYLFFEYVPYMRFGRKKLHLLLLKMYSKKVGKNFNFHYGTLFHGTNNTIFHDNIGVGRNSYFGMGGTNSIIGNNVMMGMDVKLLTIEHGYRRKDISMNKQKSIYSSIVIEDNVWIGDGVKIISGSKPLRIAKGVIIGAGSVVIENLEIENGIYVGNPSKFLRSRFEK